jgi:hypothetical protein
MRKSKKIYRKRKTRRNTRVRISKRITKKMTKKMKGGSLLPFSGIADAFSSIKYNIGNAIGVAMVDPIEVPPDVKGGDNPLPYKQPGPAVNINNYTNQTLASTLPSTQTS